MTPSRYNQLKAEVFDALFPVNGDVYAFSGGELEVECVDYALTVHCNVSRVVGSTIQMTPLCTLSSWWRRLNQRRMSKVNRRTYNQAKADVFDVLVPKPGEVFDYGSAFGFDNDWLNGYRVPPTLWETFTVSHVSDQFVYCGSTIGGNPWKFCTLAEWWRLANHQRLLPPENRVATWQLADT